MTLLAISDLNVSINEEVILKDVEFTVDQGEVFGLVGESGSGKSMTALSLMNLLPKGSDRTGQIILDGKNLIDLSEKEMCSIRGRDIGMIFQEPMTALNPVMTIGNQVAETLIIHGGYSRSEAMTIAREKLARVEMPPNRFSPDLYPHEISGGQRQRVCIALAIALRPKILIADEPTTALDVSTQAQILDLLKLLVKEEQMSLLFITHDLAVIARMADKVAVMQMGRIVEMKTTRELFQDMKHDYSKKLFAASSYIPETKSKTRGGSFLEVSEVYRAYKLPSRRLLDKQNYNVAVRGVSFSINKGESLGLVGESGCGKSTLSRTILGLDPLQKGRITVDGVEIISGRKMPYSLRKKMQVVFQDPFGSFNPRHKVGRLVAEPFHLLEKSLSASEQRERVVTALLEVGLRETDVDKYIHEFSGGQRQRIAIARAMVIKPDLVILDEAVSALDVSIRAQILDLLNDLQIQHNLSYLFISHDLTVVRAVTDRVLVMQGGEIVEEGRTDRIFDHPQHDYTKRLLQASPRIPAEWVEKETSQRCHTS